MPVDTLSSLQVGRPRPNFVALCWPDGAVVWDPDTGLAACSPNAMNPAEGRKSFPSGEQALSSRSPHRLCTLLQLSLGGILSSVLVLGAGWLPHMTAASHSTVMWPCKGDALKMPMLSVSVCNLGSEDDKH